jgi:hypothetical protein
MELKRYAEAEESNVQRLTKAGTLSGRRPGRNEFPSLLNSTTWRYYIQPYAIEGGNTKRTYGCQNRQGALLIFS